jgi:hypothetical protein
MDVLCASARHFSNRGWAGYTGGGTMFLQAPSPQLLKHGHSTAHVSSSNVTKSLKETAWSVSSLRACSSRSNEGDQPACTQQCQKPLPGLRKLRARKNPQQQQSPGPDSDTASQVQVNTGSKVRGGGALQAAQACHYTPSYCRSQKRFFGMHAQHRPRGSNLRQPICGTCGENAAHIRRSRIQRLANTYLA